MKGIRYEFTALLWQYAGARRLAFRRSEEDVEGDPEAVTIGRAGWALGIMNYRTDADKCSMEDGDLVRYSRIPICCR